MEKEMKAWQKGYELDTLIEWTNKFEDYNNFCHSPFAKAKKNGMADSLSNNKLFENNNVVYEMRTAKTTSKVKMFGAGPEIATVLAGEKVITKLSSNFNPVDIGNYYEYQNEHISNIKNVLNTIEPPVWCHIFEEDKRNKAAVKLANFQKIGTKVSTFSDIIGVYYKGGRKFIPVPETENINIKKNTYLSFIFQIGFIYFVNYS